MLHLKRNDIRILKSAGQIGSGIELGILRIRGLSVPKNLFPAIISGLKVFLCPSGKKFPDRWWVWMGFIR
jgi:hypothetical protein